MVTATARVFHREVGEALYTFATNKVKELSVMSDFIGQNLDKLPMELRLMHTVRGQRTEKAIAMAANFIAEDIKEISNEYREVVTLLGLESSAPVRLEHLKEIEAVEQDEEADDD